MPSKSFPLLQVPFSVSEEWQKWRVSHRCLTSELETLQLGSWPPWIQVLGLRIKPFTRQITLPRNCWQILYEASNDDHLTIGRLTIWHTVWDTISSTRPNYAVRWNPGVRVPLRGVVPRRRHAIPMKSDMHPVQSRCFLVCSSHVHCFCIASTSSTQSVRRMQLPTPLVSVLWQLLDLHVLIVLVVAACCLLFLVVYCCCSCS